MPQPTEKENGTDFQQFDNTHKKNMAQNTTHLKWQRIEASGGFEALVQEKTCLAHRGMRLRHPAQL